MKNNESSTHLSGMNPEEMMDYLLRNNPDQADALLDNQLLLLRFLGKTDKDWNSSSDSHRIGD